MTALTPTEIYSSQVGTESNTPSSIGAMGFAAGDVIVVTQDGIASGTAAPGAPKLNSSTTGFTLGPSTSGSDAYANAGATSGRAQQWSKLLVTGDLTSALVVDQTGFSTHRYHVYRLSHASGLDSSRVAQTFASTANTGSTPVSLTDLARPACVITAVGTKTTGSAATLTWDGATSGVKFQRAPYNNTGTSGTDNSGGTSHTNHFSTGTVASQADYQEYDTADTITSVLWNNNVNNTTHALIVVVYQVAVVPITLSGKSPIVSSAKALLKGPHTFMSGKSPIVSSAKATLKAGALRLHGKAPTISDAGAPSGLGHKSGISLTGTTSTVVNAKATLKAVARTSLTAKSNIVSNAKASLRVRGATPQPGGIIFLPDQVAVNYHTRVWTFITGDTFALFDTAPSIAITRLDDNAGVFLPAASGLMTQLGSGYFFDWKPTTEATYLVKVVGQFLASDVFIVGRASARLRHDQRALDMYGEWFARF